MPFLATCYCCDYRIATEDRNTLEIFMGLHFKNCHEKEFEGVVFSDSDEFIDLEHHLNKREIVVLVQRISKKKFKDFKEDIQAHLYPAKLM